MLLSHECFFRSGFSAVSISDVKRMCVRKHLVSKLKVSRKFKVDPMITGDGECYTLTCLLKTIKFINIYARVFTFIHDLFIQCFVCHCCCFVSQVRRACCVHSWMHSPSILNHDIYNICSPFAAVIIPLAERTWRTKFEPWLNMHDIHRPMVLSHFDQRSRVEKTKISKEMPKQSIQKWRSAS